MFAARDWSRVARVTTSQPGIDNSCLLALASRRVELDGSTGSAYRLEDCMISGKTTLIAHLGYPTEAFKAPMIYNPWFEKAGIDAVVMPMGVTAVGLSAGVGVIVPADQHPRCAGDDAAQGHDGRVARRGRPRRCRSRDRATPFCVVPTARCWVTCSMARDLFAACSARAAQLSGARVLVVGSGGVGSAIAASFAAAGIAGIGVFDANESAAEALGARLRQHYPKLAVTTNSKDPADYDVVVNATPLGMKDRRSVADGRLADRSHHLRRRGRDESGDDTLPAGRQGKRVVRSR